MSSDQSADVKRELALLTGEATWENAILKLGIMRAISSKMSLEVRRPWHRSGSESYLLVFAICSALDETSCVLKACTPSTPGLPLNRVLDGWIHKRKLVTHSVGSRHVPALYGYGHGIIVEEFIPYKLQERSHSSHSRRSGIELLKRLSAGGWDSSRTLGDFLSRGEDAVIVDFGSDLVRAKMTSD